MKRVILILLFASYGVCAQEKFQDPTFFDFWVGDWNLTWKNQDGTTAVGTNHVLKILDGKVIQENFEDKKNNFRGTSISVYNEKKREWHQAWADNQGGYFNFIGDISGDSRVFRTQMKEVDEKKIIQRMRFYDIKKDSLIWDWEMSKNDGQTWELQWRINYTRAK